MTSPIPRLELSGSCAVSLTIGVVRRCATTFLSAMTASLALVAPGFAQGADPCKGGGYNPTAVAVAVTAVPIEVESTTDDYFVLYAEYDVDGKEVEYPVLVKRGEAGTTALAENVSALPADRYRVEKYLVSDPADVDGDCIDDLTELDNLGSMNPVNPAVAIAFKYGVLAISDQETFESLSLETSDTWNLKFVLLGMGH